MFVSLHSDIIDADMQNCLLVAKFDFLFRPYRERYSKIIIYFMSGDWTVTQILIINGDCTALHYPLNFSCTFNNILKFDSLIEEKINWFLSV